MKLTVRQICPSHRRTDCCGRKELTKPCRQYAVFEPGVRRIPDSTIPRGYRELRSPAAMRRLVMKKVDEQKFICPLCQKEIIDMRAVGPDHIEPRGMGGARKDDHESNIQAVHNTCNFEKGSKRL